MGTTPTPVSRYTTAFKPLTQISPTTFRDAYTFLELYEALKWFLLDVLTPELDAKLKLIYEETQREVNALADRITTTEQEWEIAFNLFMDNVIEELEALNDQAVANLINTLTSKTRVALDAVYVNEPDFTAYKSATAATMAADRNTAAQATANAETKAAADNRRTANTVTDLDHIRVLAKFPVREMGSIEYPQGFSINEVDQEIYVSSQRDGMLRIDVRNLNGGALKSSKTFVTPVGAYSEGIPWFKNVLGQLCFIVQATAASDTYNIANYVTGALSPDIARLGKSRVDREGDNFVSSDAFATWASKFYLFEWKSVMMGAPVAKGVVAMENAGVTPAKSQAVAIAANTLYLCGADNTQNPTISGYDFTGKLVAQRTFSRAALKAALVKLIPGETIPDDYFYEMEGACGLNGKLVTGHTINRTPGTGYGEMYLLVHDAVGGQYVEPSPVTTFPYDSDWVDLALEPGWSTDSKARVRRIGGEVMFEGDLFNATQAADTYAMAAQLPQQFRPPVSKRFPQTIGTIPMAARVDPGGGLRLTASAVTGQPRTLAGIRYRVD